MSAPATPLITFGIPAYNRPALLAETLASIAAQTASVPYEVIVCDDGTLPKLLHRRPFPVRQILPPQHAHARTSPQLERGHPPRSRHVGHGPPRGRHAVSLVSRLRCRPPPPRPRRHLHAHHFRRDASHPRPSATHSFASTLPTPLLPEEFHDALPRGPSSAATWPKVSVASAKRPARSPTTSSGIASPVQGRLKSSGKSPPSTASPTASGPSAPGPR